MFCTCMHILQRHSKLVAWEKEEKKNQNEYLIKFTVSKAFDVWVYE